MKPLVVIITGLSGSGKSVALRALEDLGFYCVDNLPITLLESLVSIITADSQNLRIGIGIDIREKEFLSAFDSVIIKLREQCTVEMLFLESERDVIIRRFKETRRPHPLSSEQLSIEQAIEAEHASLLPIRRESDKIVDTSSYTPHQLRQLVLSLYTSAASDKVMNVTLISFGYKFGLPQSIDLLFDVRFIPNPYFVPELKELSGLDLPVQNFVFREGSTREFIDKTVSLLNFLIPCYREEGKAHLTIGFGCTGGKHRSPAIIEHIATLIKDNPVALSIIHRDIRP